MRKKPKPKHNARGGTITNGKGSAKDVLPGPREGKKPRTKRLNTVIKMIPKQVTQDLDHAGQTAANRFV